jgi:hypothetical protein
VLEPGNLHRLQLGHPIEFSLNDAELFPYGLPAKLSIGIAFSETPIGDAKEMAKHGVAIKDTRTPQIKNASPHCPECHSSIEQLGVWRSETPVWLVFCIMCGCIFGSMPPVESMRKL